ncbi:MAG: OmpA family protein [Bacillota bacterium]
MSRRKKDSGSAGPPPVAPWLTTYGDMVTLLLCFFVLLQSFSTIEEKKLRQVLSSIQGAFGVGVSGGSVLPMGNGPMPGSTGGDSLPATNSSSDPLGQPKELGKDMKATEDYVASVLKPERESGQVQISPDERGLVVRVLEPLLFERGKAQLRAEAEPTIAKIANVLKAMDNTIIVEGHTCDLPIETQEYPSNWELSVARAVAVTRKLVDSYGISPQRLAPTGYAEYRPVVSNTSEKNRAQNRRVDIVILGPQR